MAPAMINKAPEFVPCLSPPSYPVINQPVQKPATQIKIVVLVGNYGTHFTLSILCVPLFFPHLPGVERLWQGKK